MRSRAAIFEPIASIASGGGPIHDESRRLDAASELGVLGKEAVAGMNRIGSRSKSDLDDRVRAQIRLRRWPRPEQVGLVRDSDVQPVAIGLRVHRHRPDSELARRAKDAYRDLAAIGNENLREAPASDAYSPER